MTNTQGNSVEALVAGDTQLLNGTQKDLANKTFTVNDKSCTSQDVITVLQGRISKANAVLAARAALASAVKAMREDRAQNQPFVSAFRAIVKGMFTDPATLADFGIAPRKAPKKTLDTKVAAVAKTAETRAARGTKGKKQLDEIHGTAPAAPAASKPATPTA
jgi:hypothetical protein